MILKRDMIVGLILFIVVFGFYLHTIAPSVAPYRDSGEMVTVIAHEGVAHPPGYPLYILVGNVCMRVIPFGNTAYKINIVSALASALFIAFVYALLNYLFPAAGSRLIGLFCLILASGGNFWYVSQVSEMYSANMFACAVLLWLLIRDQQNPYYARRMILASFLAGVLLGFRMDLVLAFPALLIYVIPVLKKHKDNIIEFSFCSISLFVIGFSVYLYLLIRSKNNPVINWGSPDTLGKLMAVISRKSHGHTLDLLSVNYAAGALFLPEIWIYIKHLFWEFTPAGIPLMCAGGYYIYQRSRQLFMSLSLGFLCTGPIFIFLSNMPPNPHALAIMEPHYLLPDLFAFCLASGSMYLIARNTRKIAAGLVFLLVLGNLFHFRYRAAMRHNFFTGDYVKNIFRSLPLDGIGIAKEDVQLFSLWHAQYVEKYRTETPVIAQGLAGSAWHQKNLNKKFPELHLLPLRKPEQWEEFIRSNRPSKIFVTGDVPYHESSEIVSASYGLLNQLQLKEDTGNAMPSAYTPVNLMNEFYVERGIYRYEYQLNEQRNFFNADLIEEYSSAWRKLGFEYVKIDAYPQAIYCFYRGITQKTLAPTPFYHLGYVYFKQERFQRARDTYEIAIAKFKDYIKLTREYHTLPDVVAGIKKEFSEAHQHCGVVNQKLDNPEEAVRHFEQSIELNPRSAQSYYNLGTIYWNKDWLKVIYYLEQALKIEPDNAQYRNVLGGAHQKMREFNNQTPSPSLSPKGEE
ncbi:MAG: DUF2723 domain-containing protein [bacterium]